MRCPKVNNSPNGFELQHAHLFSLGNSNFIQVCTQEFGTVNVVGTVKLFVDRVGTLSNGELAPANIGRIISSLSTYVVTATHGEEQDVLTKSVLESQSDWDGSTFTSQVGLDVEHLFDSLGGSDWTSS